MRTAVTVIIDILLHGRSCESLQISSQLKKVLGMVDIFCCLRGYITPGSLFRMKRHHVRPKGSMDFTTLKSSMKG